MQAHGVISSWQQSKQRTSCVVKKMYGKRGPFVQTVQYREETCGDISRAAFVGTNPLKRVARFRGNMVCVLYTHTHTTPLWFYLLHII